MLFGVNKSEVNRFKKEAIDGMKVSKKEKLDKDFNFGVSKKDVLKYRKQARS